MPLGFLTMFTSLYFYLKKPYYSCGFVSKRQSFLPMRITHFCCLLFITTYQDFSLSYSQQSAEDLARVPANSTSNILNRLLVSYDPRIRPNFKGLSPPYKFSFLLFKH